MKTKWLRSVLLHDRRAAAAIMFGLTAIPIIGFTMLAIDFGHVVEYKAKLNLAADVASLTAVRVAANDLRAGDPNYVQDGITAGQQLFAAETGSADTPAIDFSKSTGTQLTASLSFSGKVPSYFGTLNQSGLSIGFSQPVNVGVNSQATITVSAYINVTLALDTSASMLIAVDSGNINTLEAATDQKCLLPQARVEENDANPPYNTPCSQSLINAGLAPNNASGPCAFACHDSTTYYPPGSIYFNDYYGLAKQLGVQLREDVVQSAAADVITQLQTASQNSSSGNLFTNLYSVGVFTFDNATDDGTNVTLANPTPAKYQVLTAVYPALGRITPTAGTIYSGTDFTTASKFTSALTPPLTTANPTGGDTPLQATMAALGIAIPAGGDGSSDTKRKQALIMVTDGMNDIGTGGPNQGTRQIQPIDQSWCSGLRANNVAIYILYTTYYPLDYQPNPALTNTFYTWWVSQYVGNNDIYNALVACTGGNTANVIEASEPTDIQAGLKTLLQAALTGAGRFTQ